MEYIQSFDLAVFKFIHHSIKNGVFDFILPLVRNKWTWLPLYLFLIYSLVKNYAKVYWKIILIVIISVICSDFICAKVLKDIFERTRPCHLFSNELWFHQFNLCSSTFSFPSCHATNHSLIAFILLPYFSKIVKYLLISWFIMIGFAQVYIGVHYPLDILGGICLGLAISRFGCHQLKKINFL